MIALGIDISTKKIAVAGIREDGSIVTKGFELDPKARGARRLVGARLTAYAALGEHDREAAIIVVENPRTRGGDMGLLGTAFVVVEAAQAACTNVVVMDVYPASWKKAVLGYGRADKLDALRFAHGLGYVGGDDDIADALCIAQLGWMRWEQMTRDRAA